MELRIFKKARSLNNEESNRNYPGFAYCFNVFVYLKRKGRWYVDMRTQRH
jgi:hypothetical protein